MENNKRGENMVAILEVNNLKKEYVNEGGNSQRILNDVNLKIYEGEFISVMGASGSGKSTLLYNISGMDKATSGEIFFNNKSINKLSEKELSDIRLNEMGFVFQQSHLLKNLCILDNILLPAFQSKKQSREEYVKKAEELMDQVGIGSLGQNDIYQASGGQLQRVSICRALINSPHIIFGDEPTGALNSKSTNEIMEILREINNKGTTVMLVTHDIKVAAKTDRVLFMTDGEIVDELTLGKFNKNTESMEKREATLNGWLNNLGF